MEPGAALLGGAASGPQARGGRQPGGDPGAGAHVAREQPGGAAPATAAAAAPAAVRLSLEEAWFLAHAVGALRVLAAAPDGDSGLAELTHEVGAPPRRACRRAWHRLRGA
jgi:hypothetical protein